MLANEHIVDKIVEDVEMSKVFSVVLSTLQDILSGLGLLRLRPEFVKAQGPKKFMMSTGQLLELHALFKSPMVVSCLNKLGKYRDDLQKFKKASEEGK